jgi:diguanylate cyclase (GGDEF)-like protein
MSRRVLTVHRFCGAVALLGGLILALDLSVSPLPGPSLPALILAAGVILGELRPLKLPLRGGDEEVNVSSTFAFALLLGQGLAAALLAQAVASVLQDVLARKPWWRTLFNVGQYSLSLGAAAGLLYAAELHPSPGLMIGDVGTLGAIVAAGAVFFLVNFWTVGIAIALQRRVPVRRYLRHDLGFSAGMAAVLISLAPIVLCIQRENPLLLILFAIPFQAVHRGGREAARRRHDATHDALTGLVNRSRFHAVVQEAIAESGPDDGVAVMLLDLDRFKEVNDTLGHHYGDQVLAAAGPRLADALRPGDVLARLGGDEFAVLVTGLADDGDPGAIAERMLDALRAPIEIDGVQIDVAASIGVARHPGDGEDVHALLRSADVAMYRAKERHLGWLHYAPDQDPHTRERLALVGDLRRALEAGTGLEVWYQPKLDLGAGRVVGVEALVRWRHPVLNLLPPDLFIPLAERTGLIKPLTFAVLECAVRDLAAWRADGLELGLAVNLSTRGLMDPELAPAVARVLDAQGVDPAWLTLEITESAIMADPETALVVVEQLRGGGVTLSIDDFGTGYSSLSYLRHLRASEIKIDRSFVQRMATDAGDLTIVKSTIDLARNLGLRVVAEGVEDRETLEALHRLGADQAQGYFLSPPRPREAFEAWLSGPGTRAAAWQDLPVRASLVAVP